MKNQLFRIESDGFNGAWYPAPVETNKGFIIMLGDSSEDRMAKSGAKWLNQQGIHVMAMSPDKKDYGHHNYPLERFGKAIALRGVSVLRPPLGRVWGHAGVRRGPGHSF